MSEDLSSRVASLEATAQALQTENAILNDMICELMAVVTLQISVAARELIPSNQEAPEAARMISDFSSSMAASHHEAIDWYLGGDGPPELAAAHLRLHSAFLHASRMMPAGHGEDR